MHVDLVLVRRRQLVSGRTDTGRASRSASLRSAISSNFDDEPGPGTAASDVQLGGAPGRLRGGAGENATAGREDRVRLVGERLHDDLAADAVALTDPPDDRSDLGRSCAGVAALGLVAVLGAAPHHFSLAREARLVAAFSTPALRSSDRTVSVGCAPLSSQWLARSASILRAALAAGDTGR